MNRYEVIHLLTKGNPELRRRVDNKINDPVELGKAFRRMRKAAHWSIKEMAERMGTDTKTIYDRERGVVKEDLDGVWVSYAEMLE